jgi:hypothetical protein
MDDIVTKEVYFNRKKEYKAEISNVCFFTKHKKRKFLFQQTYKRKILEVFSQKIQKKFLKWDSERKLFFHKTNEDQIGYLLKISSRVYLYPENVFFSKNMKFNFYRYYNFLFNLRTNLQLRKKIDFSTILLYIYLDTSGFLIFKFGLFRKNLIKPVFICFSEKKMNSDVLSILHLNNFHSFSFPISLTILALRLKPIALKLVINGTFGILSFSLNFGFSTFCPIFIIKKKKKSSKNRKELYKQKVKSSVFFFDQ